MLLGERWREMRRERKGRLYELWEREREREREGGREPKIRSTVSWQCCFRHSQRRHTQVLWMLYQLRPQKLVNRIIMISKHSSASDKLRNRPTTPSRRASLREEYIAYGEGDTPDKGYTDERGGPVDLCNGGIEGIDETARCDMPVRMSRLFHGTNVPPSQSRMCPISVRNGFKAILFFSPQ